ncbi:AsmA-like C-terminal region-containing protein [Reichenbachiella sp.]|uniref:AsmA-like C-terminal region-containing protein n=1 Tax=Reichenbachiella sp. TaxID=2184521 RepID=UPI003B59C0FD
MKRNVLKIILIAISSILSLALITIAFVLNFVFNAEKITPLVTDAVNDEIDAVLHVESIEPTFFSSFPNFQLKMNSGSLLYPLDSTFAEIAQSDTLVSFLSCSIEVNPIAFLLTNNIELVEFELVDPKIFALVNQQGRQNWDLIMKDNGEYASEIESTDSLNQASDDSDYDLQIDLENISIKNGYLKFMDLHADVEAELESLDMSFAARLDSAYLSGLLGLSIDQIFFKKEDQTYTDDLYFGIETELMIQRESLKIEILKAAVNLQDIAFAMSGVLQPGIEEGELDMDMDLSLNVPKLSTVLELIPEHIVSSKNEYQSTGKVGLEANLKGTYGLDKFPVLDANLSIENGSVAYHSMPNKIDHLSANIGAYIDLSDDTESYVDIQKIKIKGFNTNVELSAKIQDALHNQDAEVKISGDIDFTALAKTLPLEEGVKIQGIMQNQLMGKFSVSDILKKDYGRVWAQGQVAMNDLYLESLIDSVKLKVGKCAIDVGANESTVQESSIKGSVHLDSSQLQYANNIDVSIARLGLNFESQLSMDTSKISSLHSTFQINNAKGSLDRQIEGEVNKVNMIVDLGPDKINENVPVLKSKFLMDSVGVKSSFMSLGMRNANYEFESLLSEEADGHIIGAIEFSDFQLTPYQFPLELKMSHSKITTRDGNIELNNAQMALGKSDLKITGKLYDVFGIITEANEIKARLSIASKFIDCNELMSALALPSEENNNDEALNEDPVEVPEDGTNDSNDMQLFEVPNFIDFRFESKFDSVLLGDMYVNDIQGLITIKDQSILMENLSLVTEAAKMKTSLKYSSKDTSGASIGFDFRLLDIDINRVISMLDVVDSLMPMASSFAGNVDFKIQGKASLDKEMQMIPTSVKSILSIEGNNMRINDSEAFREISKLLMFKNESENLINSVKFELLLTNGELEVVPTIISIDRYRVALGGMHRLDMTYDYHISILKSPMPFKAGLDIQGDSLNLKFKLAKAKYKKLFPDPKSIKPVELDPAYLDKKEKLLEEVRI